MSGNDWVNRAVEGILFAPDREAVRKELTAHLEDRREALEAKGMTAEEAESAAAQAMGDPAEVAEALAKIHRPWWGYLWRLSQLALAVIALWAVVTLGPALWNEWRGAEAWGELGCSYQAGNVYTDGRGTKHMVLASWTPRERTELGQYRFSVPGAWLEQWDEAVYREDGTEETRTCHQLVVSLRADTWRFWEPCEPGPWSSRRMIVPGDSDRRELESSLGKAAYDYRATAGPGLFSVRWWITVDLEKPEDVPDWLVVPLGLDGAGLRVGLENEGVSW